MLIDTISEPKQSLSLEDIQFHPKVREKLQEMLTDACLVLESVAPERLLAAQENVRTLRFILSPKGLLQKIIDNSNAKSTARL